MNAMSGDSYSRFVLILKIVLPLVALGIMSTLFLLSSRIEPGQAIPFAAGEVADRIRGQQVTGPFFTGVTTSGDRIAMTASQIATTSEHTNRADEVSTRLDFANGGSVILVANSADIDIANDVSVLSGDILIESTTGFRMRSDQIETRLSELFVLSPGEVRAVSPAGNLRAGRMEISNPITGADAQLLFSGGVKLIYDPKESGDQ